MTEFTGDGLRVNPQDLSTVSPEGDDDDRMFHHDGSSSISIVGGGSDSARGYYIWDTDAGAWYPLFRNADKIDGKEAGDFLWRDGSLAMEGDLDANNYGIINVGEAKGGSGGIHLNTNHVEIHSHDAGKNIRLIDSNGLLLAEGIEGGNFNIPNGELQESGNRVATRSWTQANADVPNADYADNANNLDGNDASAFLHVSGDQMEGVLDLGQNNVEDGSNVLWDAVNTEVPQSSLGGPAASLSAYPLAAGDLAEDYAVTSRFPLPASDLAEDYVLTSRLPLPASDLAEDYALSGHNHDGVYILESGDTMSGVLTLSDGSQAASRSWVDANADVPNADYADTAGDSDTLDGEHATAFADSGHTHDGRYYTESESDSNFAASGHLHDSRYILESGDTMGGVLTLSDGSTAASQSWVNSNADVPNADYADSAGDADTVDGLHADDMSKGQSSASFTSTDTSTDINKTSWTQIPWDVQKNIDAPYTHDPANSPEQITFDEAGTYQVYASISYDSSDLRQNPGVAFSINGTLRNARGLSGYSRHSSGHLEASNSLMETFSVSAGDTLRVETTEYGNSGTATLRSQESTLEISSITTRTVATSDADTVDGQHAAAFLQSSGDTMTGSLKASDSIQVSRDGSAMDSNNSIESTGSWLGLDSHSGASGGVLLGYYNAPEVRVGNGNLSDFNWNGDTVATRPWVNGKSLDDWNSANSDVNIGHNDLYNVTEIRDGGTTIRIDDGNNRVEIEDGNNNRTDILSDRIYLEQGAGWFTGDHSELQGVGSSDHHTRYSDSEARSAIENGKVQEVNLEDRDNDGAYWRLIEHSNNGHLQFDSVGGGGTQMDLEHNGNVRFEGEITENASL